jgi:hypothetical protein
VRWDHEPVLLHADYKGDLSGLITLQLQHGTPMYVPAQTMDGYASTMMRHGVIDSDDRATKCKEKSDG